MRRLRLKVLSGLGLLGILASYIIINKEKKPLPVPASSHLNHRSDKTVLMASQSKPQSRSIEAPSSSPIGELTIRQMIEQEHSLAEKAMLTEREQELLKTIVNNVTWQESVLKILVPAGLENYSKAGEKHRLESIDSLSRALRHGSSSTKDRLYQAIEKLIHNKDYTSLKDGRLKKSFIGDKIELLILLKRHSAADFEVLAQTIKESDDRTLLFALRSVEHLAKK